MKCEYPQNVYPEVVHAGIMGQEQLIQLYNEALFFAFPSLYEGFGLPVLEAMSCGTPVIGANAGAIPEVAGDAAMLVNPFSEVEIAETMRRLLQNESLRTELSQKGLVQSAKYSWRRTAEQTYQVYRKIIG